MSEAPHKPDMEAVRKAWRALTRALPTWSLPFTALISPSAYHFVGNDLVSVFQRSKAAREAQLHVKPVGDAELFALDRLAQLNVKRGEQYFRFMAAAFVSVPIGALLALNELYPDLLTRFQADLADAIIAILSVWVVFVALQFASVWRMRHIALVIALELIERGSPGAGAGIFSEGDENETPSVSGFNAG